MPDPVLVGRDENKLQNLCSISGIKKMSTDLDQVLADPLNTIYFDSQTTSRRADAIKKAVKAGIFSLVWIDVGLVAAVRGPQVALAVAILWLPAYLLGRWLYST